MGPKTVYFVRHGESEGNAQRIFQSPDVGLSQSGITQAKLIAERVYSLRPEVIFSSTMRRAYQTVDIILERVTAPVEYLDCFRERRMPSLLIGKPHDQNIMHAIRKGYETGKSYADEEVFDDLKSRGVIALELLTSRNEATTVCITHEGFLSLLLGLIIFNENFSGRHFSRLLATLRVSNTGLTRCTLDNGKWHIRQFNDDAHLGELKRQ